MVKTVYLEEILEIPKGVDIKIDNENRVTIKGSSGSSITKDFGHATGIRISHEKTKIKISSHFPKNKTQALIGTISSIINNLIIGFQKNYKYFCKICYSHFPFSCEVHENKKEIHVVNFLGERAPRKAKLETNVKVILDADDVILEGPDKESLGQTAANLKRCCRIRKKDPRVFQDGVYLYKTQAGDEIIWQIK